MMRKLLFLMLLATATMTHADDYVSVVAGGAEKDYHTQNVAKIEFTQDGINVIRTNDTGDTYLFSDGVEKIMFHPSNPSAITTVKNDGSQEMTLFVARNGNYVRVNGWMGDKAQVSIYALNGQQVLALGNWKGSDINVSALPSGIYVIKVGNKSAKFRK